jgi:hypothetical protein
MQFLKGLTKKFGCGHIMLAPPELSTDRKVEKLSSEANNGKGRGG